MPAPKGSRNAKPYQEAVISKNKTLVSEELSKLKEARANFDSMTALSQAIATRTGLTDVTIRRNHAYRQLIIEYINEQGSKSGYTSRAEAELNRSRQKITELELRLSNINADNNRLRAFIANMHDAKTSVPKIISAPLLECENSNWELDCRRTYHLVNALLSHSFYEINFIKNTIEDRTGIENSEIVAGANLAQPFIEWSKMHHPENLK